MALNTIFQAFIEQISSMLVGNIGLVLYVTAGLIGMTLLMIYFGKWVGIK